MHGYATATGLSWTIQRHTNTYTQCPHVLSKALFREARKMRLYADFAERGTANSVHGMNAEGGVANCWWAAESTRNGGA